MKFTFCCEHPSHTGATGLLKLEAADIDSGVAQARQLGWLVRYDGPGHGWIDYCPLHAGAAPQAPQSAARG